MCTLSLIRPLVSTSRDWSADDPLLFRVVVNRDELRTRAAALPPTVLDTAAGRVVMPVDAQGGGTWVAAAESGLVFALLNGADAPGTAVTPAPSRGWVIPRLVESESIDDALRRLQELDLSAFRPWRLIVSDGVRFLDAERRAGGRLRYLKGLMPARFMATSSSRRQAEALRRRSEVFRELVVPADERTQDRFHVDRCEEDPALGVLMERADARTVSRTTIEIGVGRVLMCYQPLPAGSAPSVATTNTLLRHGVRRGAT